VRVYRELAARADVIHHHFPWPFGDLTHLLVEPGRPTVVTYHSDVVRQQALGLLYQPLMHRFLGRADAIVATSENYRRSSPVLGRYADKCSVIPIGIADSAEPPPSRVRLARWREDLGSDYLLFVGALRYYKGLFVLLEAARHCRHPLVVLGAGPLEAELRALIARYDLQHVRLVGAVDDADKLAIVQLCRALVFPSNVRSEAFGIALLEAAMLGKPQISAEIGTGTSWVNQHGQTGLVVPPNDPNALAAAMATLAEGPALAAAMGGRARQRYLELFTADAMAAAYLGLYRRLAASPRGSALPARRTPGTNVPQVGL
jgi:rhamnosyl/mannosyltransferase